MKDRVEERLLFWLDITYEFYMSRIEAALAAAGSLGLEFVTHKSTVSNTCRYLWHFIQVKAAVLAEHPSAITESHLPHEQASAASRHQFTIHLHSRDVPKNRINTVMDHVKLSVPPQW